MFTHECKLIGITLSEFGGKKKKQKDLISVLANVDIWSMTIRE